jgi:hypothetical protein
MSTNLTFATCGCSQGIRFVLVNNRVPCTDERCALCGGTVEQSYARDLQTRLIYCEAQCFPEGTYRGMRATKNYTRKVS